MEWPASLTILDQGTFDQFIEKYPLSLVDFYSPTCGPCIAFSRTIRHVSRQYKNRVAFGKLDVTKSPDLAKRYKAMSVPYTVMFSYGKKAYTLMGKKSEKELTNVLEQMLDKYSDRGH